MLDSTGGLLAEAAIMDVHKRYCRGLDRLDFAMVRACFHRDAELDYGYYEGGVDGFIKMAKAGLATYSATTHFIGNQLVEVHGDRAWAEHYVVVYHRCPGTVGVPEHDFICNYRYVDRMEWREAGRGIEWRIAERALMVDSWRRVTLPDFGPPPRVNTGTRDYRDLSWSDKFRRSAV